MSSSQLVAVLQKEDVIPEVVPEDLHFAPLISFNIVWSNGKQANLGNFLTRDDTLEEPEIYFTSPSSSSHTASYTLVMTDPDAPSRKEPKYRQFRHWVITGLKVPTQGAESSEPLIKTKASTTPYRPPGPPPGSEVHRYTFLLFEEPVSGFDVPQGDPEYGAALEERRSWNAVDFGKKHGLKLVGANLFLVQAAEA